MPSSRGVSSNFKEYFFPPLVRISTSPSASQVESTLAGFRFKSRTVKDAKFAFMSDIVADMSDTARKNRSYTSCRAYFPKLRPSLQFLELFVENLFVEGAGFFVPVLGEFVEQAPGVELGVLVEIGNEGFEFGIFVGAVAFADEPVGVIDAGGEDEEFGADFDDSAQGELSFLQCGSIANHVVEESSGQTVTRLLYKSHAGLKGAI